MLGDMTSYALKQVYDNHAQDLKSLNAPEIKLPEDGKVPQFTVAEIHEMYTKANKTDTTAEKDLTPDEERWISDYARKQLGSDLVYAVKFPVEAMKFYHKLTPEDTTTVLWGDLLCRGLEMTTVPMRATNYENMVEQMNAAGTNPQDETVRASHEDRVRRDEKQ